MLVTLSITAMYVGLQQIWLGLSPVADLMMQRAERSWPQEAATVAAAARDADRRVPQEWRLAAFRLGYHVGYLTERLGGFAMSDDAVRARARAISAPLQQSADDLARAMGVDPAAPLPIATIDELVRVDERLELDELGLATRMERKVSLRHRHLLMLGMHVGVTVAMGESTYGELIEPKRRFIGHHATLAGVPAAAWEPLARTPDDATAKDRLTRYMVVLASLEQAIARLPPLP